jgi:hypothetical protein
MNASTVKSALLQPAESSISKNGFFANRNLRISNNGPLLDRQLKRQPNKKSVKDMINANSDISKTHTLVRGLLGQIGEIKTMKT